MHAFVVKWPCSFALLLSHSFELSQPLTEPGCPSSEQVFHFMFYCGTDEWIVHETGSVLLNTQHDG